MFLFRFTFLGLFLLTACGPVDKLESVAKAETPPPVKTLTIEAEDLTKVNALTLGSSKHEVIEALGKPTGEMNMGVMEIIYYHGVAIELKNDVVTKIPDNLSAKLKAGYVQRQKEELVLAEKAAKKAEAVANARQAAANAPLISQGNKKIRKGGEKINIYSLVGKGNVTIIDFYADWCGPCRQIEPHLKKLAADPKVNLIQIDIKTWGTPVTSQYQVRSIPNMRVFDANGRQVGQATSSLSAIRKYVAQAKKNS